MAKLNCQQAYSSFKCHMMLQKSFQYADLVLKKHFKKQQQFLENIK